MRSIEVRTETRPAANTADLAEIGLHPSVQALAIKPLSKFAFGRGRLQSRTGRNWRTDPPIPMRFFRKIATTSVLLGSPSNMDVRNGTESPAVFEFSESAHELAGKRPARPEGGCLAAKARLAKPFLPPTSRPKITKFFAASCHSGPSGSSWAQAVLCGAESRQAAASHSAGGGGELKR
jgi:hypothetical protein